MDVTENAREVRSKISVHFPSARDFKMSTKKVNVLIYSGPGATLSSVRHATWSLRRLLGANYAVLTVTGDQILKEPWSTSCALLVMPGGADLGYCRTLNGEGNRRIRQYVEMGGKYLGLCAGGYYGCGKCEFEVGRQEMEVIGDRELGFFPGVCRGLAFPGFVYHSEAGARAAVLKVHKLALTPGSGNVAETFRAYYNGGGVFVDAEKYKGRGVEVLASYADELAVDSGEGCAAIVYCKVGDGAAVLTGPHPEYAFHSLIPIADIANMSSQIFRPQCQPIGTLPSRLQLYRLRLGRRRSMSCELHESITEQAWAQCQSG